MSNWISVKDKLPENNDDITLYSLEFGVVNGYYWPLTGTSECNFIVHSGDHCDGPKNDVTHWIPKPNPPEN